MNNIVILPLIIPFLAGLILIFFRKNILFQRIISTGAIVCIALVSLLLIGEVSHSGIQVLHLGGWEAPFGISIVADMFAVLLVFTSSIVSFACLIFAFRSIGEEREKHYFYPFYLFLLTGVNGSFLTGDLFNLFVCFEVMLIASYVLISLGNSKIQLRASMKYVLVNVFSSMLFLVAVAYIYAMTGTLNIAHLSVRVAEIGQDGLMTTVAILLFIVFSLKAALFLFFWLPESYSAPPTAIAAIFAALLTKVGIYAIFRMYTIVFYHEPEVTHIIIAVMGAATMLLGSIGAVAYSDIRKIMTYNVIIAVGFILSGLAAFTSTAVLGSIYYLIHDIIVKALLFLLGGTVISVVGTDKLKDISGLIRNHPALGWMFFLTALSIAGIPPLSGFIGKIFITQGTFEVEMFWLGFIGLLTSLAVLYSLVKVFINGFWGETLLAVEEEKGTTKGLLFPITFLTVLTILLGLGAEGLYDYVKQATDSLMNPSIYIRAVLGD